MKNETAIWEDAPINIKLKLAGLWTAATLCFVYQDIVGLYRPGVLDGIVSGKMGPLGPTTQGLLLGVAIFMSTPCCMIFLSLILKPKANRLLNITFALVHTLAMMLTLFTDPWNFYIYFAVIEILFTGLILWFAWKWPKVNEGGERTMNV